MSGSLGITTAGFTTGNAGRDDHICASGFCAGGCGFPWHVAEGKGDFVKPQPIEAVHQPTKRGKKPSKYRNVPTWVDGIRFDSKKESAYYGNLILRKAAGEVSHFELQPRFELVKGVTYVADFKVTLADGTVQIVDVKGVKTAVYRMKKKLLRELLGLEVVEV